MMKSKFENLKIVHNGSKLGWYWAPLFAISWFLLFYLVVPSRFHYYPEMLRIQDEATQPGSFIGERAEQTLLKLSEIGPKVVGSTANEKEALNILLNEIGSIKQDARLDLYNIEHEVQVASGNYATSSEINAYHSIQNVVVKVTPKRLKSNASLLLNSHFDSRPGSPGAGDDGLMVAVMLETLRVITKYETSFNYSIIFLFNGAEEVKLLGSHAFITQHKWAKNIGAFINLDAAGSGGRELLFRVCPGSWLLKYYGAHAVHPYASVVVDVIFENGFVNSDTDFAIFTNDGNLTGVDMATILNDYVYHTKYDRFSEVPRGSYQSIGENVLALTKALASAPELENPQDQAADKMVYFDVLGWFFISYTQTTGLILNIVVCIVAVLTILAYIWNMSHQTGMFWRRILAKFGILLGIQCAAVVLACAFTFALALLMDVIGLPLSWYSQKWLIFGLYFCPMFFILGILPAIYLSKVKEHGLPLGYAIQLIMHSHCLILVVIEIILIAFNSRIGFFPMIAIGFYTLSVMLNIATCFHNKTFLWLIPHILCQIFPFLFFTYNCYMFFEAFVPIAGRSGDESSPEKNIAGIAIVTSILSAAFLIPIFLLFRKSKIILSCFAVICVVFIVLAATPVGFPYVEKPSAKRIKVQHATCVIQYGDPQMSWNRTSSGFFVVSQDYRTSLLKSILDKANITAHKNVDNEVNRAAISCAGLLSYSGKNILIPGPKPQLDGWPALRILSKQRTSKRRILYSIEVTGPDHMRFYITPLEDGKLVDWSFNKDALDPNHSSYYTIRYTYGLDSAPLQFNLEFERESPDWSGPAFYLTVIGDKFHHHKLYTNDFREFLSKFPAWTVIVDDSISSCEFWRL